MLTRKFLSILLSVYICQAVSLASFVQNQSNDGQIYAILIAGEGGLDNYALEANLAHSYHLLLNHGVPAENIIMFMYDDVANDPDNPFPGKLINEPGGRDYYAGLKIDYRRDDVTVENFIAVLEGNSSATRGGTGRVLQRFFVPFGSKEILVAQKTASLFTTLITETLALLMTAKTLNKTLWKMSKNKKYAQLTFYLEACFSGSMFENILPNNTNIYVSSATNSSELGWMKFCGTYGDAYLCLSCDFSYAWMHDSEHVRTCYVGASEFQEDLKTETLETQYEIVKKGVNRSHVQQYGEVAIASEPVAFFQGDKKSRKQRNSKNYGRNSFVSIPIPEVKLRRLSEQLAKTNDVQKAAHLEAQIKHIHWIREQTLVMSTKLVLKLIDNPLKRKRILDEYGPISDLDCHHIAVTAFTQCCARIASSSDGLGIIHVLSNLCGELRDAESLVDALCQECIAMRLE